MAEIIDPPVNRVAVGFAALFPDISIRIHNFHTPSSHIIGGASSAAKHNHQVQPSENDNVSIFHLSYLPG